MRHSERFPKRGAFFPCQCKALIARQQELVRRIAQRGQPTDWAQNTLRAFESNLRAFEAQRNEIVAQIDAEQ